MGTSDKIKELEKKLKKVSEGDQVRIDKQHKAAVQTNLLYPIRTALVVICKYCM